MNDNEPKNSRRGFLSGAAGVAAVAVAAPLGVRVAVAGGHLPKLSTDDPTAVALGYVEKSATDGQTCGNCQLYTGKADGTWGPCQIFPGKEVATRGWCKSWVKKAG